MSFENYDFINNPLLNIHSKIFQNIIKEKLIILQINRNLIESSSEL